MKKAIPTGVQKIAVLRANMLGDFIVSLPALSALRGAYPQAEIVMLASPWLKTYAQGRDFPFDRVVVVPVSRGVRIDRTRAEDPIELEGFFNEMKKEHFDIAIQLHGGGKNSNPFVLKLGARLTAGMRTPDAPSLDRTIPYFIYHPEILRYLEVVGLLGVTHCSLLPKVKVLPGDVEQARNELALNEKKIIVLHPGASEVRRRWPAEKFAHVGDYFFEKNMDVVITGTNAEKSIAEKVIFHMQHPAINAVGRLSLAGLTGLLSQSSLLVSNDTGPLHLARAVGTATVGIYHFTNIVSWGPIDTLHNRIVLSTSTKCPQCGVSVFQLAEKKGINGCEHGVSFVSSASVDEVIYHAKETLMIST